MSSLKSHSQHRKEIEMEPDSTWSGGGGKVQTLFFPYSPGLNQEVSHPFNKNEIAFTFVTCLCLTMTVFLIWTVTSSLIKKKRSAYFCKSS